MSGLKERNKIEKNGKYLCRSFAYNIKYYTMDGKYYKLYTTLPPEEITEEDAMKAIEDDIADEELKIQDARDTINQRMMLLESMQNAILHSIVNEQNKMPYQPCEHLTDSDYYSKPLRGASDNNISKIK